MKKYIILSAILLTFSTTSSAATFEGIFPILQGSKPGIGRFSNLFHYKDGVNTQYKLETDFTHESSFSVESGALRLFAEIPQINKILYITGSMSTNGTSSFDLDLKVLDQNLANPFLSDTITFTPEPATATNVDINIFKIPNTYLWGAGVKDGDRLQIDLGFDPMPIPSTLALMGLGLAGFGAMRTRKQLTG